MRRGGLSGSRATSWLLLGLLAACGGGETLPPDGGPTDGAPLDVTVVDAPPSIPDAGLEAGADAAADAATGDDGGLPGCSATAACDPVTGSGCGPDGWCVLRAVEPECVDATGRGEEGSPCRSGADCRVGLACYRLGDAAVCARPCCDDAACGFGARCVAGASLVSGATPPWGRCTLATPCDVLAPTESCPPGEGCYVVDGSGATACRPAGSAGAGEACVEQEDCRPGFYCGGPPGGQRCVRICALDGTDGGCPPGEGECVRAGASPEGTGLCVLTGGRRRP